MGSLKQSKFAAIGILTSGSDTRTGSSMKDEFRFIYLAYGGQQFRKQAVISISSMIDRGPVPGKILVYTDRPEEYENLPVETVLVTKNRIRLWKGPYGYTHRVKIELVGAVFRETGKPVIFVDSDTIWANSLEKTCEHLREGYPVMYEREGMLEAMFPQYNAALGKTELLGKAGLPLSTSRPLWVYNSGLIGLPSKLDPRILDEVIRSCDFLCRNAPFKMEWVEQVAFSHIFQAREMEIKTCVGDLYHYWHDSFELGRLIGDCSQDELMQLGREPDRVLKLIEEGKKQKRTLKNQLLVRARRLKRSFRKRRREFLVFLELLKLRMMGRDGNI